MRVRCLFRRGPPSESYFWTGGESGGLDERRLCGGALEILVETKGGERNFE